MVLFLAVLTSTILVTAVSGESTVSFGVSGGRVAINNESLELACLINDYPAFDLVVIYTSADQSSWSIEVYARYDAYCLSFPTTDSTCSTNISGIYVTINTVDRSIHQCWWSCNLTYAINMTSDVFYLNVYTPPKAESVASYTSPPSSSKNLGNNNVTMIFETTSCVYPAPLFTWYYAEDNTRVPYTNISDILTTSSSSCSSEELKYRSTLTIPQFTRHPANILWTTNFSCGITHPALNKELFSTPVDISFAVKVTGITLHNGSNTPDTGKDLVVLNGDTVFLGVSVLPAYCRPTPTVTCYIGTRTGQTLSGTSFTFSAKNEDHGKDIYCTALNTDEETDAVVSNKPRLYVIIPVTDVMLKDGSTVPDTGHNIEVQENEIISLTVDVFPSNCRPSPTITCHIGSRRQRLSGTRLTFTARNDDHGQNLYCTANNTDAQNDMVTSNKPRMYVKVPVIAVTLKASNTTLNTLDNVTVQDGENVFLTVDVSPANCRPPPTITCYIGTAGVTLSGTALTFTARREDNGKDIYCTANNTNIQNDELTSNKPRLYVIDGRPQDGFKTMIIVGGVVSGAVVIILTLLIFWVIRKFRTKKKDTAQSVSCGVSSEIDNDAAGPYEMLEKDYTRTSHLYDNGRENSVSCDAPSDISNAADDTNELIADDNTRTSHLYDNDNRDDEVIYVNLQI